MPSRPRARHAPVPARLPLLRRRSSSTSSPGVDRVRRAATARARPTWSRRSATSPRWAPTGSPATRRWCGRRRAGGRPRRRRPRTTGTRCSSWRSTRARPTGRGSTAAPLPRPRELLGVLRTVLFSPEDLALVKGDPRERRRFLDELLVLRTPRLAGVRADYDRVLRQRNTLLKSAGARPRGRRRRRCRTLDVWDEHLARTGAELLAARLAAASPTLAPARRRGVRTRSPPRRRPTATTSTVDLQAVASSSTGRRCATGDDPAAALLARDRRRRGDELDRGMTLVGPHRDDLAADRSATCRPRATRATASPGRGAGAAAGVLRAAPRRRRRPGADPRRRVRRARRRAARSGWPSWSADAEQVLVTAAVADDVPEPLKGHRFESPEGRSSVTELGRAPDPMTASSLARDIAKSYRRQGLPVTPAGKRRVRPAKPARATADEPSAARRPARRGRQRPGLGRAAGRAAGVHRLGRASSARRSRSTPRSSRSTTARSRCGRGSTAWATQLACWHRASSPSSTSCSATDRCCGSSCADRRHPRGRRAPGRSSGARGPGTPTAERR